MPSIIDLLRTGFFKALYFHQPSSGNLGHLCLEKLATLAYGVKGLRRGISTWDWPFFHDDPQQENNSQMERWSLNQAPTWTVPPLAIANRHYDTNNQLDQNTRYRLILAKASNLDWLTRDRHAMRDLSAVAREGSNHWVPIQDLPFDEIILFALITHLAPYVCLPSGLYHARSGRLLQQSGPNQRPCLAFTFSIAGEHDPAHCSRPHVSPTRPR